MDSSTRPAGIARSLPGTGVGLPWLHSTSTSWTSRTRPSAPPVKLCAVTL